jgi:hypothetical protein
MEGSFITYLFIEAMEPASENMPEEKRRKITSQKERELSLLFIEKSLSIEELFDNFLRRFNPYNRPNDLPPMDYENALKSLLNVDLKNLLKSYLDETIRALAYHTVFTLSHSDCSHR